ncbi:MAG TPA: formyl transferase [Vicinamibacterales bacterium]|nr:formyl transferase [Vicinamibacterales bacterium]
MRILCCLNRDLASNVALNLLLPALARHDVRIGLTERVGNARLEAAEAPERRELRTAEQQLPNDILFPLVERAALPDDGQRFLTFAELERHRGIPVAALANPNAGEGLEMVRAFAPDLVLTIRYGAILQAPVIAVPRLGVLNLHSGLLPAYRGVLATFRALLHGDTHIGCTAHYITDGTIDTGPVVGDARIPVVPGRSLLWHVLALYEPGVALLASAVDRLEGGATQPVISQPAAGGAYYSYPNAADWAAFTKAGWTVAQPSDVANLLRRYLPAAT